MQIGVPGRGNMRRYRQKRLLRRQRIRAVRAWKKAGSRRKERAYRVLKAALVLAAWAALLWTLAVPLGLGSRAAEAAASAFHIYHIEEQREAWHEGPQQEERGSVRKEGLGLLLDEGLFILFRLEEGVRTETLPRSSN